MPPSFERRMTLGNSIDAVERGPHLVVEALGGIVEAGRRVAAGDSDLKQFGSKSLALGRRRRGATSLSPTEIERRGVTLFQRPTDCYCALGASQGAVLGRVGCEFVKDKREALSHRCTEED